MSAESKRKAIASFTYEGDATGVRVISEVTTGTADDVELEKVFELSVMAGVAIVGGLAITDEHCVVELELASSLASSDTNQSGGGSLLAGGAGADAEARISFRGMIAPETVATAAANAAKDSDPCILDPECSTPAQGCPKQKRKEGKDRE